MNPSDFEVESIKTAREAAEKTPALAEWIIANTSNPGVAVCLLAQVLARVIATSMTDGNTNLDVLKQGVNQHLNDLIDFNWRRKYSKE